MIDVAQEGTFINNATVTAGEKTNSATATVNLTYKTEDMIAKSGKYNYETNTYDWTITFNNGKKAVQKAVITDYLPDDHIPVNDYINVGSIQVYLGGAPVNGISASYNEINNTITVSFDGYVLESSGIRLSTKYVGEETQGNATNKGELKGDNFSHTFTANATVTYKPLPVLEKKTDYTSGDVITWKVVINLDHDNLGKLSLVDQLNPGLNFDASSVKLYLANIDSNGTVTATQEEIPISTDLIQYEQTTGLVTIGLPEDLNTHQSYVLVFDTEIKDKTLTSITNSITFNGTDFQEDTTSDVIVLKTTSSSSGIVGNSGTVRIMKLDEITEKPLKDVAFQLLNADKEVIESAGWAVTNEEGIAEFKNWLRLDTTYYIQEVRTLEGYVYDDSLYEVIVDSNSASLISEITVYNEPDPDQDPEPEPDPDPDPDPMP